MDIAGLQVRDPAAVGRVLDALPLAPPRADGILHFDARRPGALQEPMLRVAGTVFNGDKAVTARAWGEHTKDAERVNAWHEEGCGLPAAILGAEHLAVLDDSVVGKLHELCELDERNKRYFTHLQELEKLLIYQRDLFAFCRNFIALTDLIDPERRALFERGSLVMAGREFQFAMRVRNLELRIHHQAAVRHRRAAHPTRAGSGKRSGNHPHRIAGRNAPVPT